ncbi:hypothetical protein ES708_34188 [subsurface metagenome]
MKYIDNKRGKPINPKMNIKSGDRVTFVDKRGEVTVGSIRIREIYCGKKGCSKCPHKIYAYVRYRKGKKVKEKYIGVAR